MAWIDEAARCRAAGLPVGSRMIVFGSQARGEAKPDSDVEAEALAYNALVESWPELVRLTGKSASRGDAPEQRTLI